SAPWAATTRPSRAPSRTPSTTAPTRPSSSPATARSCSARSCACSASPKRPARRGSRSLRSERAQARPRHGPAAPRHPGRHRAGREPRAARAAQQGLLRPPRAGRPGAGGRRVSRPRAGARRHARRPQGPARPHARGGDRTRRGSRGPLPKPALARAGDRLAGRDLPPRLGPLPGSAARRRQGAPPAAPARGGPGVHAVPARQRRAGDLRREPLRPRARLPRPGRDQERDRGPRGRRCDPRTAAKARAALAEARRRASGQKEPAAEDPEALLARLGDLVSAAAAGDLAAEKDATALARGLAARGGPWPGRVEQRIASSLGDGKPTGVRSSYGLWLLAQLAVDRKRCADVAPLAEASAGVHDAGRARHRPELLFLDAGCRLNAGRAREAADEFATLLREFPDAPRAREAAYYRFRA